jgi:hypothetical protein
MASVDGSLAAERQTELIVTWIALNLLWIPYFDLPSGGCAKIETIFTD